MRTRDDVYEDLRTAFHDLKTDYQTLLRRAFPEIGNFFRAGWPVPADLECEEIEHPELSGATSNLDPYISFVAPPWRQAKATPQTFRDFLALADARPTDWAVLKFARRYGPLTRIGKHPDVRVDDSNLVIGQFAGQYVAAARQTRSVLRLAEAIRHKRRTFSGLSREALDATLRTTISDWRRMMRAAELHDRIWQVAAKSGLKASGETARQIVSEVHAQPIKAPANEQDVWRGIARYLEKLLGGNPFSLPVVFEIERDTRIQMHLSFTLETYLALQTLAAIGRHPGVAMCECGRTFTPKRQVSGDRKAWCDACRRSGKSVAAASRRYYQRNRQKVLARIRASRKGEIEL